MKLAKGKRNRGKKGWGLREQEPCRTLSARKMCEESQRKKVRGRKREENRAKKG